MKIYLFRRKFCWKILCVSGFIYLFLYIFKKVHSSIANDTQPKASGNWKNLSTKYLFNLAKWRDLTTNLHSGRIPMCEVPAELSPVATAICHAYNLPNSERLPCQMIYSSPATLEDLNCVEGGYVTNNNADRPSLSCQRGFSLDLFLKKNENDSYPSIIADSLTPFSSELYVQVLNNKFRSSDSAWGFVFNFESISYYPWNADKSNLKLFDVTFGYDRSIYDFVPAPWLYDYLDKLTFNPKRLLMKQVIANKKLILLNSSTNRYWISEITARKTPANEINKSYVTAPILWMNSNCETKSNRTEYVDELMKYIEIDNYGTCGMNILRLPDHIVKIQNSENRNLRDRGSYKWQDGKLALSSEYLFTIAIENSINYDYITEKLWHPLVAGSIPIYLGAPNVEDWLPCETDCIVDLRKFKTPRDAAEYIKLIAANRTLYESYHIWRGKQVHKHFEKLMSYFQNISKYSLDCMLCDMSHRIGRGENSQSIKKLLQNDIGRF